MGKYKKGVLGSFRGKIGTVIGSVWKGIHYMRSLPDVSPNRKPTEGQLNHQQIFAMIIEFLKPIKLLISTGYKSFQEGVTPMNAAASYHLKYAVTGIAPNYEIDCPKVILSVGDLEAPVTPAVVAAEGGEVDFTWGALADPKLGALTDQVTLVAYNPVAKMFSTLRNAAARSELTCSLQLPADWIGTEVACYMSFASVDGKVVSNSAYAGQVTII